MKSNEIRANYRFRFLIITMPDPVTPAPLTCLPRTSYTTPCSASPLKVDLFAVEELIT